MTIQAKSAAIAVDRGILAISTAVALAALSAMFVSLIAEVVVRYMTNKGLGWPTELPNLLFPWLVMSGVVIAAQRGQHIAVTAIMGFLGKKATRSLLVLLQIITGLAFFYLAYVGADVLEVAGSETYPVTGISAYWAYLAMVVGFIAVGITAITTICQLYAAEDPLSIRTHVREDEI